MDLGMIFLCLVIGCLIGFEVGKSVIANKLKNMLMEFADNLKKSAEEERKRKEELTQNKIKDLDHVLDIYREIERIGKENGVKGDSEKV